VQELGIELLANASWPPKGLFDSLILADVVSFRLRVVPPPGFA
jgi:hypothetical protein